MPELSKINLKEFYYSLPKNRIAQFPLKNRDESKLLVYRDKKISEDRFNNIHQHLPDDSLLIYNETRVIHARLQFQKETGANIEIFCLEPVAPTREIQQAFEQKSGVTWKCLVGNSKKWKDGELKKYFKLNGQECTLKAKRVSKNDDSSFIEFFWEPAGLSFSEILEHTGIIQIPPYMNRETTESDKTRYQTIYARAEGSVAAPTAGLHFTDDIFSKLKKKNISSHEVTLHVGAGTFKPISSETIEGHEMHTEQIRIKKQTLEKLIKNIDHDIIAVGTTTLRTLESIYWHGVKLLTNEQESRQIDVHQWDPYQEKYSSGVPVKEALEVVVENLNKHSLDVLSGQTQLMIVPGYDVKMADVLISNFHMPKSTLLLLVSAFIGDDWKVVYRYALNNRFRFLSYGDSCLFFKTEQR